VETVKTITMTSREEVNLLTAEDYVKPRVKTNNLPIEKTPRITCTPKEA